MRDRHDNDFFSSDFDRSRNESAGNQYRNAHHNRDWADRASDEVQSWFGDSEAEHRRRIDEHRNYNSSWHHRPEEANYPTNREYYAGYQPQSNYRSANERHYGTQSPTNQHSNFPHELRETRHGSSQYDPLRSIYGGPGHTTDGYSHESRRDFVTGSDYHANRPQPSSSAPNHRDWADRTGDEVRSWFGNEEAERRRRRDDKENQNWGHDRSWHNDRNHNRW